MVNKWKISAGLVTLILLVAGVYFVGDIYASSCHKGGGEGGHKDDGKHKKGEQPSDSAKAGTSDDSNSPDNLLKTADKLLKDVAKTKDIASLMKHCEQMLNKTMEMVSDYNHQIEEARKLDGEVVETAIKLMKKCVEMTTKYQSLAPKEPKKDTEKKVVYVCPMGCVEPQDKPGKCSKCGMNLVKNKD